MHNDIESHLIEKRVLKPPKDFAKNARIKSLDQYRRMYRESIKQPDKFWGREASELVWRTPWKKVLDWKAPFAKWFVGGKLNVSENCLDRHSKRPAPKQGRDHLGGRAGRQARSDLPATASRSLPVRQCPEAKQNQEGRSRHHLHADDSGGGDRDAGLRADRRGAFGGLWRIQRG